MGVLPVQKYKNDKAYHGGKVVVWNEQEVWIPHSIAPFFVCIEVKNRLPLSIILN